VITLNALNFSDCLFFCPSITDKPKLLEILKKFSETIRRPKLEDAGAVIRIIDKLLKYMKVDKIEATQVVMFPLLFVYTHLGVEDRADMVRRSFTLCQLQSNRLVVSYMKHCWLKT